MKPGIFTYIIAAIMLMFAFYIVPLSWNNMMLHSGTPDSVLGNSGLTAQFIDNVLCTYNSPACRTGADMIDAGWHHDVSPTFALAFFWQRVTLAKSIVVHPVPPAFAITDHGKRPMMIGTKPSQGRSTKAVAWLVCRISLPSPMCLTLMTLQRTLLLLWLFGRKGRFHYHDT